MVWHRVWTALAAHGLRRLDRSSDFYPPKAIESRWGIEPALVPLGQIRLSDRSQL